jgi:membrane protein
VYVPHLIEVDAQRYGVIGVAFAIVSWLVIVAYLLVGTAVVGAELGLWVERRGQPRPG